MTVAFVQAREHDERQRDDVVAEQLTELVEAIAEADRAKISRGEMVQADLLGNR